MFSTADTIVAIATPPGRGGIGIVRISGSQSLAIAAGMLDRPAPLAPRHATFARIATAGDTSTGASTDHVVATFFPGPSSYTGEDVVEISAHGTPVVLEAIVRGAMGRGARLAQPGEFTLRAFLYGKLNLVEAEAVADLVEAATPAQARVAFDQLDGTLTRRIAAIDASLFELTAGLEASLDFPDEGYHFVEPGQIAMRLDEAMADLDRLLEDAHRGRAIREGATVVLSGRTNVGKSSIFNKLTGSERAIVTAIPGTTRDLVTERVDLDGLCVTLVDTAGDRITLDEVEREGVARASQARGVADLVIVVLDSGERLSPDDERLLEQTRKMRRLVVANKADRQRRLTGCDSALEVSAETGEGMSALRDAIVRELTGGEPRRDTPAISNARHIALLREARLHLDSARRAAAGSTPEEFVMTDLAAARACFDEVVGVRTSDDVLNHIFERFCIGK